MWIFQRARLWLCAAIITATPLCAAQAQSFPDRPIHLIIGLAPGGGVDSIGRVLAQQLTKIWGQPVVVENRLGAAGATANEYVARSTPDGYTLLFTSDDITALSAFRGGLPYDLMRDFQPVSLAATAPDVLAVNAALPVHNVKELIALAKSEPGKLTYATGGVGGSTHIQTALMASMAHIDIVHVPYKGSSAGVVGVAAGEVDMTIASPTSVKGLTKAGKLRVIAVTSGQRWPLIPALPTISESGLPGYGFVAWYGMLAPVGIPKDVLETLNAGVAKAANSPEMKAALVKQSAVPQPNTPEQFRTFIRTNLDQRIAVVKAAGIKADK